MRKTRGKKKNKKISNNYLGMALISCVVLILLAWLAFSGQNLSAQISVYETKAAALEQSIEEEKERTEQIDARKEYMQTEEYAAEVARDKLGLVKENEIVFEEEN